MLKWQVEVAGVQDVEVAGVRDVELHTKLTHFSMSWGAPGSPGQSRIFNNLSKVSTDSTMTI